MTFVTKLKSVGIAQILAVPGSGSNPRVQMFPPEYLEILKLQRVGFLGTFVCIGVLKEKNQVTSWPAAPRGQSGTPRRLDQKIEITLEILGISDI
jgi:hypothetical protein